MRTGSQLTLVVSAMFVVWLAAIDIRYAFWLRASANGDEGAIGDEGGGGWGRRKETTDH